MTVVESTAVPMPPKGFYDRNTAGAYLACSPKTIDRLCRDGVLESHVPLGFKSRRRIPKAALDAYIAAAPRWEKAS